MNGHTLRIACAIVLAILGAFWFEVDFSSSHQVAHPAAIAQAAEGGVVAAAGHPLTLAAIGGVLTGGVVTALPPWGVLAVATAYLLGRLAYKQRRMRR